jgi:hypothetical protein
MSVRGLVSRGFERYRAIGGRRFVQLLSEKYVRPFLDGFLFASLNRRYEIGRTFKVSVPVFSLAEARRVFEDLAALEQAGAVEVDVRIVSCEPVETPKLPFPVNVTVVETPRLVLSLTLWFGHVYLPTYVNSERASELKTTLGKLGVAAIESRSGLLQDEQLVFCIRICAKTLTAHTMDFGSRSITRS